MKKEFSKNTTEVYTKTMFHYIPQILKYIDEIKDPRKSCNYSMRYLIISEMLMFLSEGKSQRFTETAFVENNYLENIKRIIKEEIKNVPDAEIYTEVFSRIEKEEIENFYKKIMKHIIRNKFFEESKVMGKYNCVIDGTRFQKAHYEVSKDWLYETKDGLTNWYLSMLDMKIVANGMAISLMNEMINNEDKKIGKETEEEVKQKNLEKIKQDCEYNASKRLIEKFRKEYPRLPVRIMADSLYPSEGLIKLCEKEGMEYIFVLKDKKIPTILKELLVIASILSENRILIEKPEEIKFIMWANEIDYSGEKVNVIRQITRNKETQKDSIWMWITNRKITEKNVMKIIKCARSRDYIENQGFREQKVTSGIELEHVYSKNVKAIKVIYIIIQLVHMLLQIMEHSDICGDFKKKYGSVKVFCRRFYAYLTENLINIELIQNKIQIRFDKSTLTY